jgi:seryl-tRNA synthetase
MLEIQRLRSNTEEIVEALKKRHFDAQPIVDELLSKDEDWRAKKTEMESVAAEMNKISKEIGLLFREGKTEEANAAKEKTGELKQKESDLKVEVDHLEKAITELMYQLPNVPNKLVKAGKSEEDNEIVSEGGKRRQFSFEPKPHWELTEQYNLIDFELGVKITGAGFPIYRGKGARLQRALIAYFLDKAQAAGYEEFIPPHVVNEASGFGTGQLPIRKVKCITLQRITCI